MLRRVCVSLPVGGNATRAKAGDGTRTRNLLITNQLLCQLSYAGTLLVLASRRPPFGAIPARATTLASLPGIHCATGV